MLFSADFERPSQDCPRLDLSVIAMGFCWLIFKVMIAFFVFDSAAFAKDHDVDKTLESYRMSIRIQGVCSRFVVSELGFQCSIRFLRPRARKNYGHYPRPAKNQEPIRNDHPSSQTTMESKVPTQSTIHNPYPRQ